MADNVTIPAVGTGDSTPVVATDDVGGAHYQRVKLDGGADGAAAPITVGQKAKASSVPVTLASDEDAPRPYVYSALGYESLAVSTTAVGLASIPAGVRFALVRVETANVRYRDDGTNPTSSEGMLLQALEFIEYAAAPSALRFIRVSADAVVKVLYYG